jgi:hypothetical protein
MCLQFTETDSLSNSTDKESPNIDRIGFEGYI